MKPANILSVIFCVFVDMGANAHNLQAIKRHTAAIASDLTAELADTTDTSANTSDTADGPSCGKSFLHYFSEGYNYCTNQFPYCIQIKTNSWNTGICVTSDDDRYKKAVSAAQPNYRRIEVADNDKRK